MNDNYMDVLLSKPVLIGLHLGLAILGIDAFLWLLGELIANTESRARKVWAAAIGVGGFAISWLIGGYYYVTVYGTEVKPVINAGLAPWAHAIVMEAKEHIFLFMLPLAVTILFGVLVRDFNLRKPLMWLTGLVAGLGLLIGLMGYIISAAARWGAIQ